METARLTLRRWAKADLEPFAAMNADPDVMRYFPAPLDRAASDAFVEHIETDFDRLGFGLWALEVKATGEFIGFTGLAPLTFKASFTPAIEISWRLARCAWRCGYATEAARSALAYGFGPAGLDEIVAITTRANTRSQAVMRRLGMTYSAGGDFDHPLLPAGHPLRPHVLYRLARHHWRAATATAR